MPTKLYKNKKKERNPKKSTKKYNLTQCYCTVFTKYM